MTGLTTDRLQGLNAGLSQKAPVAAASTANLTLSGEQTVDGVALVTGDRILVKNQTTSSENGIYSVDTGAWDRTLDCDGSGDIVQGTFVFVNAGSTNARTWWYVSTASQVIGSSITWTQSYIGTAVSTVTTTTLHSSTGGAKPQLGPLAGPPLSTVAIPLRDRDGEQDETAKSITIGVWSKTGVWMADARVVLRHVLYLGEINSCQQAAWRKTIEVFETG